MARIIKFVKMHGADNDYVCVDATHYPIGDPEKLSKEWSVLHAGIGSDGLVLVGRSGKAGFNTRVFNADGSGAKICGNTSRCIDKYLYDYELTFKTGIALDTLSGIKALKLYARGNRVDTVTVDIGIFTCEPTYYSDKGGRPMKEHPIKIDGVRYTGTTVSMGNPHLVIFINGITKIDFPVIGPELESHPFFPGRANVEFAQALRKGKIEVRVWERGSGIIQAYGTEAYATTVAAFLAGCFGRKAAAIMDGGTPTIKWDVTIGYILITGNAIRMFGEETETDDE